jgi:hypothetical protein
MYKNHYKLTKYQRKTTREGKRNKTQGGERIGKTPKKLARICCP